MIYSQGTISIFFCFGDNILSHFSDCPHHGIIIKVFYQVMSTKNQFCLQHIAHTVVDGLYPGQFFISLWAFYPIIQACQAMARMYWSFLLGNEHKKWFTPQCTPVAGE